MTPKTLADALGCFWNAAAGAARERQSLPAIEFADVLTAGVAAVAARLEEHGEERDRRISELLEANNRYQQEAWDAWAVVVKVEDERDRVIDAAKAVCLAAWTDRHSRLHGHETVEALDKIVRPQAEAAATEQKAPPPPPWPAGAENNANAKRAGWNAFFRGVGREDCEFPPARLDLQRDYRVGWDAAKEASL